MPVPCAATETSDTAPASEATATNGSIRSMLIECLATTVYSPPRARPRANHAAGPCRPCTSTSGTPTATASFTPLTLAEAGRVGTTDPQVCRETTETVSSSWSRASRAVALAAMLAVGALAALASGGVGDGVALAKRAAGRESRGRLAACQAEETREAQVSGLAPEIERPRLGEPEAEAEEPAVTTEKDASDANDDAEDARIEEAVEIAVEDTVERRPRGDRRGGRPLLGGDRLADRGDRARLAPDRGGGPEPPEEEATPSSALGSFPTTATRYCAKLSFRFHVGDLGETRSRSPSTASRVVACRIYADVQAYVRRRRGGAKRARGQGDAGRRVRDRRVRRVRRRPAPLGEGEPGASQAAMQDAHRFNRGWQPPNLTLNPGAWGPEGDGA